MFEEEEDQFNKYDNDKDLYWSKDDQKIIETQDQRIQKRKNIQSQDTSLNGSEDEEQENLKVFLTNRIKQIK